LGIALTSGNDKEEETDLFHLRTVVGVKSLFDIEYCSHYAQSSGINKWWSAACTRRRVSL